MGLELLFGRQFRTLEIRHFQRQVLLHEQALVVQYAAVLSYSDVGLVRRGASADPTGREKRILPKQYHRFEYLVNWYPRKQKTEDLISRPSVSKAWVEARPGKRLVLLVLHIEQEWQTNRRHFGLVVYLVERTTDKNGPHLLFPNYQLVGWWTSLNKTPKKVIALYREYAIISSSPRDQE